MSNEKKRELEERGLIVLNKWQAILIIASMIISASMFAGSTTNRLSNVEVETLQLKQACAIEKERLSTNNSELERQVIELKINLKAYMESKGYQYQEK